MTGLQALREKTSFLLKDGFFHILFGNTLNKMIAFVSSIVIVRLVSKNDYAYLSYADNLYSYINLFAGLGVSTSILKVCAPQKSCVENVSYLKYSLKIGVVFQFAFSILLVIFAFSFPIPFPAARPLILIMALYPALVQLETTIQSYIRAMLKNKLYARMGILQTIVVFAFSVFLVLIIGINGIVIARYIAIVAAMFLAFPFLKENFFGIKTTEISKNEKSVFWKLSLSLMLANVFSMIMPINEMFLINNLIKDEIVTANYKVSILIPSQIVFIANSVIIYFFPKIAQKSDNRKSAFNYSLKIGLMLLGIIVFICIIGIATTPIMIKFIYGNEYNDAAKLSAIYWIVYGVNAGIRMLPMNILPAMGVTFFNSILSVISCLIHFGLLYVFINGLGITGAALALIIVYLISGIIFWFYLYRFCGEGKK